MIVIISVVIILVFLLFLVLKRAVKSINRQAETYFVDKLQSYDDLIKIKEDKIADLEEKINEKSTINEENKSIKEENVVDNSIDLTNFTISSEYQSSSALEMKHMIDEKFDLDFINIIEGFINESNKKCDKYDTLIAIKNKFDLNTIYKLECLDTEKRDDYVKELLNNKEYKIYCKFLKKIAFDDVEEFLNYLNFQIQYNSPVIHVLVGNKQENYDYLSNRVKTIYDSKIYKGIKIRYKNKVYDYSISEGRGIV